MDSEEALTAIPLLRREDLNREIENDEIENGRIEGIRHFHYNINSNGIVYLNLYFNLEGCQKGYLLCQYIDKTAIIDEYRKL